MCSLRHSDEKQGSLGFQSTRQGPLPSFQGPPKTPLPAFFQATAAGWWGCRHSGWPAGNTNAHVQSAGGKRERPPEGHVTVTAPVAWETAVSAAWPGRGPPWQCFGPSLRSHSAPPGKNTGLQAALLETLVDLLDRSWGDRRSLHSNEAFLAQARRILSSVEELTVAQDGSAMVGDDVGSPALESKSLQSRLAEQRHALEMSEVMAELHRTRKELNDLRQHLDTSLEENSGLKSLLFSMKKEVKNADAAATLNLQITGLQTSVTRLCGEIVELKQHLEHYDKIPELTQMLQESHSSLISTNEHLLQELSQVRAQHRAEVEQMHWSYKELKKTMALFPHGSAGPRCC
ncbi:centrosomal protein of 72 kDa-like [Callithrix jacchus]